MHDTPRHEYMNGEWLIHRGNEEELREVVRATSYMAKVRTKENNQGREMMRRVLRVNPENQETANLSRKTERESIVSAIIKVHLSIICPYAIGDFRCHFRRFLFSCSIGQGSSASNRHSIQPYPLSMSIPCHRGTPSQHLMLTGRQEYISYHYCPIKKLETFKNSRVL